jgi:hypothetical protein
MHNNAKISAAMLDQVIKDLNRLPAAPEIRLLITTLERVKRNVIELGIEAVELENALKQAQQYLPYLPDDFTD